MNYEELIKEGKISHIKDNGFKCNLCGKIFKKCGIVYHYKYAHLNIKDMHHEVKKRKEKVKKLRKNIDKIKKFIEEKNTTFNDICVWVKENVDSNIGGRVLFDFLKEENIEYNKQNDEPLYKRLTKESSEKILNIVSNSKSIREAYVKFCEEIQYISFNTFRKITKILGIWKPNQAGKGIKRNVRKKYKTEDILKGKHPNLSSKNVRNRLLKEGIFEHKCMRCGLTEWLGKPIPLELHHKNGLSYDHRLENLELLCPNCHALTETYKGKNVNRQ